MMGALTFALPVLVLSLSVIFNYSLYHTVGLDDTAVAGKTTTEATTVYNQHDNNAILQIRSSKQTYRPGETVIITITNNGKSPLEFRDSTLGLTIQDIKTQQKAGLIGLQVISQLKPNESKKFEWDQKDIEGKQVQPGTYDARTSYPANSNSSRVPAVAASITFAINANP
jgi:hypothetical protein